MLEALVTNNQQQQSMLKQATQSPIYSTNDAKHLPLFGPYDGTMLTTFQTDSDLMVFQQLFQKWLPANVLIANCNLQKTNPRSAVAVTS
jgi:hypothetical protein